MSIPGQDEQAREIVVRRAKELFDERVENIRSLTETLGLTIDQAMAALKIPVGDRVRYKTRIQVNPRRKTAQPRTYLKRKSQARTYSKGNFIPP